MNKLINDTLKEILKNDELMEKLLLIDNIDDLYDFFISQKSGYTKNDLVKHFVQIAKENMVSEESLENVSGGNINKKLSKALCLSLSALSLASFPTSAKNTLNDALPLVDSTQNNIKRKIFEKIQKIQDTIKDHPIASAAAASSLTFLGLYKSVLDPQIKSLKQENNEINRTIRDIEDLRNRLTDCMSTVNQQIADQQNNDRRLNQMENDIREIDQIRRDNQDNIRRLNNLSAEIQQYVRDNTRINLEIDDRLNVLTRNITNLQNQINQLEVRDVSAQIQNINIQIQNILDTLSHINEPARDYHDALNLIVEPRCELSDINGSVYVTNYITRINVDITNTNDISNKLDELCRQFNHTRGIEVDDIQYGWQQTATEYFFTETNMYNHHQMQDYHKIILAQCIQAMYQNKDEAVWQGAINSTLLSLSSHGGHCQWRAEALINTTYDTLRQFLRENGIEEANPDSDHNVEVLMNDAFTSLKDKMIETAKKNYLNDNTDDDEPLFGCNCMVSHLKYLFGASPNQNQDGVESATRYFENFMNKKYLMQEAHVILDQSLEEGGRIKLFGEVDQENISFVDYCRFASKSQEEIQRIVQKISDSNDDDAKAWANGEQYLTLENAMYTLAELYAWDINNADIFEVKNAFGFKFLTMCFNHSYLQELN